MEEAEYHQRKRRHHDHGGEDGSDETRRHHHDDNQQHVEEGHDRHRHHSHGKGDEDAGQDKKHHRHRKDDDTESQHKKKHHHHREDDGDEGSDHHHHHGKKREREEHHHHQHKKKERRRDDDKDQDEMEEEDVAAKYAHVQPGGIEDRAATLLQRAWRSQQEKRRVMKLVLLKTWNVLDYDDERKGLQADRRFADLDSVVRSQVALVSKPEKKKKKKKAKKPKEKKEKKEKKKEKKPKEKKEKQVIILEDEVKEGDDVEMKEGGGHAESPAAVPEVPASQTAEAASGDGGGGARKVKPTRKFRDRRSLTNEFVRMEYFSLALPPEGGAVTHSYIKVLIKNFKKGRVLHKKCVRDILDRYQALVGDGVAVQDIDVPEGGSVCVVGDTHGQLADLLTIFRLNGYPTATNRFLFNGDFVDRGSYGAEICLLLFLFKLCDPTSVYLNRGNHECRRLNEKYAFEEEANLKYDAAIFDRFQELFCTLSLATVISGKIFVAHGGLFREDNVSLDELRKINHRQQTPTKSDDKYNQHFEDLLWSDPRPIDGRGKSTRGAGVLFGSDVTKNFLQRNNLKTIIRSHELMAKGYAATHGYQLITIFSASNYCGTNDNYGAVVKLKEDLVPDFVRYKADPHQRLIKNFSPEMLRENTLFMLKERIYNYRSELGKRFAAVPHAGSPNLVTKLQWRDVMEEVLELPEVPWLWFQPYLAEAEPKADRNAPTLINYKRFLDRYQITIDKEVLDKWEDLLMKEVMVKLYQKTDGKTPEEAFQLLNDSGGPTIPKQDFIKNLRGLSLELTGSQVTLVASALDVDKDQEISKEEFVNRFRPVYHELEEQDKKDEEWLNVALKVLGRAMRRKASRLEKIFARFDADGDSGLSYQEFSDAIRKLGLGKRYSTEQRLKIAEYIDTDKNGVIDWVEFSSAFKEDDAWKKEAIQRICNVLYRNRFGLQRIFSLFDTNHSGSLDVDEFKAGLRVLNKYLDPPLSDWQVEQLHRTIDTSGDGTISYAEFVAAFKVVDTLLAQS